MSVDVIVVGLVDGDGDGDLAVASCGGRAARLVALALGRRRSATAES